MRLSGDPFLKELLDNKSQRDITSDLPLWVPTFWQSVLVRNLVPQVRAGFRDLQIMSGTQQKRRVSLLIPLFPSSPNFEPIYGDEAIHHAVERGAERLRGQGTQRGFSPQPATHEECSAPTSYTNEPGSMLSQSIRKYQTGSFSIRSFFL